MILDVAKRALMHRPHTCLCNKNHGHAYGHLQINKSQSLPSRWRLESALLLYFNSNSVDPLSTALPHDKGLTNLDVLPGIRFPCVRFNPVICRPPQLRPAAPQRAPALSGGWGSLLTGVLRPHVSIYWKGNKVCLHGKEWQGRFFSLLSQPFHVLIFPRFSNA
jgi:hypothetical protein